MRYEAPDDPSTEPPTETNAEEMSVQENTAMTTISHQIHT